MVKVGQPQNSIEVWDAGVYPAKVVACEETESTYPGSEGKPRFKWTFRVTNAEGEATDIPYWTNTTLSDHPQATLRPLVRAVMPQADIDGPDAEIDTDDLIGKRCRVLLGINEKKGYNRVEKVLPAEGRKVTNQAPTRQPRAAVEEVDESEDAVPF